MEEAVERSVADHDKKAFQRKNPVGDKVLLKVKNLPNKNAKLAEKWKGPFVITKVYAYNTVVIKYLNGTKEYLHNTEMLKMFNEAQQEEKKKEADIRTQEPAKRTYNKPTHLWREIEWGTKNLEQFQPALQASSKTKNDFDPKIN